MANLFNNPVSQINNRDTGSIPSSKLSGKEVTCEICGKKFPNRLLSTDIEKFTLEINPTSVPIVRKDSFNATI